MLNKLEIYNFKNMGRGRACPHNAGDTKWEGSVVYRRDKDC